MAKRFLSLLLCLFLLCGAFSVPAYAKMKSGPEVQLAVCGSVIDLNDITGYICRDGSNIYIPLIAVARALGYEAEADDGGEHVRVSTPMGEVQIQAGARTIACGEKSVKLPAKSVLFDDVLMCDSRILEYLGADSATYPLNEEMRLLGYTGPTMVINRSGESVLAPALNGDSFAASLEAAKLTDQIVAVQYNAETGSAVLSFHEKLDGVWRQHFSCAAILGSNGIGKSAEDDGKTPRGTYDLPAAFGTKRNPGTELPYTQVGKGSRWCRDCESQFYNQLVQPGNSAHEPADEDMSLNSAVFRYGVVVDYNADCVPGKGSGICICCTDNKHTSTYGCIAVPEDTLKALLKALKPGAKIVIF